MQAFKYVRPADESAAIAALASPDARPLAGGTNLVDLMKIGVESPKALIDVSGLPFASIEMTAEGLEIGANVRNADLAWDPVVRAAYPALSEALLSGASPQLRNLATTAGNLMQRTRCTYFRDTVNPRCNKRAPGSGCAAMDGWTRMHAILGTSDQCIAAHPSDMCVALAALDASVVVHGPSGARQIAMTDFHVAPGAHPNVETTLGKGELITHVLVPKTAFAARSRYVKVRDRASYAFALASCAAALAIDGSTIKEARIALGGVATKPWRSLEAERALVGKTLGKDAFAAAAEAAIVSPVTKKDNAFKVALAKKTIVRALALAGGAS